MKPFQRKIYKLLNQYRSMKADRLLDDDGFNKQVFILAHELGKEGLIDESIVMILKIDSDYFGDVQITQAEEDVLYKYMVIELETIIRDHRSKDFESLMPTQAPADC